MNCPCLVGILNAGDSFVGTSTYESCLAPNSYETALVISEAQGNIFRGSVITKIKNKLLSKEVKGFFSVTTKQLVMVPEDYSPSSIGLVCQYDPESQDDAVCTIASDNFERRCGRLGLKRTPTGE